MPEPITDAAPAATLTQTSAAGESLAATSSAATNVASQAATIAAPAAPATPVAEKPISQMSSEEHRDAVVAADTRRHATKTYMRQTSHDLHPERAGGTQCAAHSTYRCPRCNPRSTP